MSVLRPGDDRLHYSDNSHRWIAPGNVDQTAWDAGMRAHLFLHLATMGGPVEVDQLLNRRPMRPPSPRMAAPSPKKSLPRPVNGQRVPGRSR